MKMTEVAFILVCTLYAFIAFADPPAIQRTAEVESTVQQTISSVMSDEEEYYINILNQSSLARINCKVLGVGPDGLVWQTITLYSDNAASATYANGVCKKGGIARRTKIPILSGNRAYTWVGAWIQGGANPDIFFWPNGQFAYGKTARSWIAVMARAPVTLDYNVLVAVDESGRIVQVYQEGGLGLMYPDIGPDVRLPN